MLETRLLVDILRINDTIVLTRNDIKWTIKSSRVKVDTGHYFQHGGPNV